MTPFQITYMKIKNKAGANIDLFVVMITLITAIAINKNLMLLAPKPLKSGRFFLIFEDNNPHANKINVICPQGILLVWLPVALLASIPLVTDSAE